MTMGSQKRLITGGLMFRPSGVLVSDREVCRPICDVSTQDVASKVGSTWKLRYRPSHGCAARNDRSEAGSQDLKRSH